MDSLTNPITRISMRPVARRVPLCGRAWMVLWLFWALLAGHARAQAPAPPAGVSGPARPYPGLWSRSMDRPEWATAADPGKAVRRASRRDPWFGKDKADHLVVSGVLVGLAYYAARRKLDLSDPRSRNLAAGFSLSLGLMKEVRDQHRPGNFFSLKDLAADGLGLALGYLLCSAGAH